MVKMYSEYRVWLYLPLKDVFLSLTTRAFAVNPFPTYLPTGLSERQLHFILFLLRFIYTGEFILTSTLSPTHSLDPWGLVELRSNVTNPMGPIPLPCRVYPTTAEIMNILLKILNRAVWRQFCDLRYVLAAVH